MGYFVGETFKDLVTLVDSAGTPITGASFTVEVARTPTGGSFAPTVLELGSGGYQFSWLLSDAGVWLLQVRSNTTPTQRFVLTAEADLITTASPGIVAGTGTDRATLRRAVADRIMDLLELTATQATTGATFKDEINLLDSDHAFRGSELLVLSGANIGRTARVLDSDEESATLTLTPALAGSFAVGDRAELYNRKSVGFPVAAYNRIINTAIREAFPANVVLLQQSLPGTFDKTVGTIAIPAAFTHVSQLWYQETDGRWWEVPVALSGSFDQSGWSAWYGAAVIHVGSPEDATLHGKTLRLVGYGRAAELAADTDLTTTDPQWVATYGAYRLLASRGRKDPEVYALMGMLKNEADVALAKMASTPKLPNTIRVR